MYKIEFNNTMNVFQIIRSSDDKIHTIPYKTRPLAKKVVAKMLNGLVRFNELSPTSFTEGFNHKYVKQTQI